jgi:hypothetical protein
MIIKNESKFLSPKYSKREIKENKIPIINSQSNQHLRSTKMKYHIHHENKNTGVSKEEGKFEPLTVRNFECDIPDWEGSSRGRNSPISINQI